MRKPVFSGFPFSSDTNRSVQLQKKAILDLVNQIEELYYPFSENKGTDQLRSTAKLICAIAKFRFSHDAAVILPLFSLSSRQKSSKP